MSLRSKLLGGLLLLLCATAQAQQPREVFSVRQVDLPNGGDLYGRNHLGCDITVTLELDINQNLNSRPPVPVTLSIPGHSEVLLTHLRQRNRGPWRYSYRWHYNYGNNRAHHDDSVAYDMPLQHGQSCRIMQGFHGKFSHQGDDEYAIDFDLPDNTPVLCCREGVVVYVEERFTDGAPTEEYRNKVNCVRVRHSDGSIGEYDHLRLNGAVVEEGQQVQRGDLIGYSGHSGFASGPHLHFCVYTGGDGYHRHPVPIYFRVRGEGRPVELQQDNVYAAP